MSVVNTPRPGRRSVTHFWCIATDPPKRPPKPRTPLHVIFRGLYLSKLSKGADCTKRRYADSLNCLEEFLGRQAVLADLNNKTVCEMFVVLRQKHTAGTVRFYRSFLVAFWRWCFESGYTKQYPNVPLHSGSESVNVKKVCLPPPADIAPRMMCSPAMRQFIERYAIERGIQDVSAKSLISSWAIFEMRVGYPVGVADIDHTLVNSVLAGMEAEGKSPFYMHGLRCNVMSLWRYAYENDRELPEAERQNVNRPRRVRKIRLPELILETWTREEVQRLVDTCDVLDGEFRHRGVLLLDGFTRAAYFRSLIRAAWSTGLRHGDLRRLRRKQIPGPDVPFVISQHKTGKRAVILLDKATVDEIDEYGRTGVIWPMWGSYEAFRKSFCAIVEAAGLEGSFKRLRKSSGSDAEQRAPGLGHLHLGNTRRVFESNYLSTELLDAMRPRPQSLEGDTP